MTLGYGVMMQHGRKVGCQRAKLQRSYYVLHGFCGLRGLSRQFGPITYSTIAGREVTSGPLVIAGLTIAVVNDITHRSLCTFSLGNESTLWREKLSLPSNPPIDPKTYLIGPRAMYSII